MLKRMMKQSINRIALALLVWAGLVTVPALVMAQQGVKYYRYVNEEGVKVINSTIPPKYVKNGYEIVTPSGDVLEVVPPAPTEEELAELAEQAERDAELEEWDTYLLRRYSTVADIEKAKQRKIDDFTASLSILRGNVASIQAQIEDLQARAANQERQGREVPQVILDSLETLKAERAETERLIDKRLEDQAEMEAKFDRDVERFKVIRPQQVDAPEAAEPGNG